MEKRCKNCLATLHTRFCALGGKVELSCLRNKHQYFILKNNRSKNKIEEFIKKEEIEII